MVSNWTWECLCQELRRMGAKLEPLEATYMGKDERTDLAWFKVVGIKKVVVRKGEGLFAEDVTTEDQDDWIMVQLPGSHAVEDDEAA